MKFSILICTHNPRPHSLRRVLDALRAQTLSANCWELFLIDNASLNPVAKMFDLGWHPNGFHLQEEKLGKTHALLLGIARSRGEMIVVVDDDNVLDRAYLEVCGEIAGRHPHLGAWGGGIKGEFEIPPPPSIIPYLQGMAICELEQDYWSNLGGWSGASPYGAGMCVRRRVAEDYAQKVANSPVRRMLGRAGLTLVSGEDTDMANCAVDLGMGTGRFKALKLTHLIPKERLTEDYVVRLYEGLAGSEVLLNYLRQKSRPRQGGAWSARARLALDYLRAKGLQRRIVVVTWRAKQAALRVVRQIDDARADGGRDASS